MIIRHVGLFKMTETSFNHETFIVISHHQECITDFGGRGCVITKLNVPMSPGVYVYIWAIAKGFLFPFSLPASSHNQTSVLLLEIHLSRTVIHLSVSKIVICICKYASVRINEKGSVWIFSSP